MGVQVTLLFDVPGKSLDDQVTHAVQILAEKGLKAQVVTTAAEPLALSLDQPAILFQDWVSQVGGILRLISLEAVSPDAHVRAERAATHYYGGQV